MADSSVLLEVIVEGKNIKLVQRQVEELGSSVNRTSDNTRRNTRETERNTQAHRNAGGALDHHSRGQKGVAQATANGTKAFSKQRDLIGGGGFVAAYATIAANVFAITAAFDVLRRNAALRQLEEGLSLVGASAGRNLPVVSKHLQEITGFAIDSGQAMRSTALAVSAGFSTKQLGDLAKVAKGASIALGRDMGDALDRLVRGTAKIEPEILDELGIIVKLDEAVRKYAQANKLAVNDLNSFQRSQAFLNATIDQGLQKFSYLADGVDPNPYDQLAASFKDLAKAGLDLLAAADPLIRFLSKNDFAFAGVLAIIAARLVSSIVPAISEVGKAAAKASALASFEARSAAKVTSQSWIKTKDDVVVAANNMGAALNGSMRAFLPQLQAGNFGLKELQTQLRYVQQAENLRFASLRANGLMATAAKIEEYNATVLLRQEIERLIAAERSRTTTSSAGQGARGRSIGDRALSRSLGNIERARNPLQLLSATMSGLSMQFQNVGRQFVRTSATLGRGEALFLGVRNTALAAANSVRILGFAFLNAIPFIGQALLIFSLFKPLLDKLFGSSKYEKAAMEASEAFNNLADVAVRLSAVFKDIKSSELDKYLAGVKVQAGNAAEVAGAIAKYRQSLEEANKGQKTEVFKDLVDATNSLKEAQQYIKDGGVSDAALSRLSAAELRVKSLTEQYDKLTGQSRVLNEESRTGVELIIKRNMKEIQANGLAETLADNMTSYQNILDNIDKYKTFDELEEALKKAGEGSNGVISSFSAMEEGWRALDKIQQDSLNKQESTYDKYAKALIQQSADVKTALEGAATKDGAGEVAIGNLQNEAVYKSIVAGTEAATRVSEGFFQRLVKNAGGVTNIYEDHAALLKAVGITMQQNSDIINESKERADEFTNKAKALKDVSSANAVLARQQAEYERSALEERLRGLNAQIENESLMNQNSKEARKIIAERDALQAAFNDKAQETFDIAKAEVAEAKRLLDVKNKISAVLDKQRKLLIDNARLEMEIANAQTYGSAALSGEQELALAKKAAEDIAKIENDKYNLKVQGIMLEWQLLNAQIELEKAKIQRLKITDEITEPQATAATAALTGVQTSSMGLAQQQISLANQEREANIARAEGNVLIKEAELSESERVLKLEQTKGLIEAIDSLYGSSAAGASIIYNKQSALFEAEKLRLQTAITAATAAGDEARALELQAALRSTQSAQDEARIEYLSKQGAALGAQAEAYLLVGNRAARLNELLSTAVEGGLLTKGEADLIKFKNGLEGVQEVLGPQIEQLKAMGPQGELVAAFTEGSFAIVDAFTTIADAGETMSGKLAAVGSIINSISSILAAQGNAAVAAIDKQIEAEKKRDGKSKESLAKIAMLEKKKEAQKKKSFEMEKKLRMASIVMSTASAVAGIVEGGAKMGPLAPAWWGAMIPLVIGLGAAQLAIVAGSSYEGSSSVGSAATGPTSISMGGRKSTVDLAKSQSAGGELGYLRGEMGTGGPENFTPAFMGAKYRAQGGATTGYVVGEQGPELFVPNTPGMIVPNSDITTAPVQNINFSINTIDSRGVEQVLLEQRGNIIGMLRESANSYGNSFLEEVDLGLYTPSAAGAKRA